MPNRVGTLNTFGGLAPAWSLPNLDANFSSITTALNDASLGYNNYIGVDSGGANNYVVNCTFGVPTVYNVGMTLTFKPAVTNTGPSTIAINSLGTAPIQHGDGTACIGGEIQAGKNVSLIYNGTAFQIQGPPFGYGTSIYYDYDDFTSFPGGNVMSATVTAGSKLLLISGSGTGVSGVATSQAGHPGLYSLTGGSVSGQAARAITGCALILDVFTITLRAIVATAATIDSNQHFFGLCSNFNAFLGPTNNEIGFFGNNSSGFWQMLTGNGSAQTLTPTTQVISGAQWYDLMLVANAAGATFFINGTQVGTQNTNYPAASATMNAGLMLVSNGTPRSFNVDLFEIMISGIPILTGSTNPRFLHGLV